MLINKLYGTGLKTHEDILHSAYDRRSVISFINPVNYLVLRKKTSLVKDIDYVFCDGILASKWFSLLLRKNIFRASFDFTSLAEPFFKFCLNENKKVYFVGSKELEITNFINLIKNEYPGINIVGYKNGYFNTSDVPSVLENIKSANPDVLVCGMGCSRQEEFIVEASKYMPETGLFITCGGFFHQTQKTKKYYPHYVNKFHLRMPYRFIKEKHTRDRLPSYPMFIYYSLIDLLREKMK